MKSIFLFVTLSIMVIAQALAQDSTTINPANTLFSHYNHLKNALVAGNVAQAQRAAAEFVKTANSIDFKIITEGTLSVLVNDASSIIKSQNLEKQRSHFAKLSENMAAIARTTKVADGPLYYTFCPMKKKYWLSTEKNIQNPYYGNSMLTCGEVVETIQ